MTPYPLPVDPLPAHRLDLARIATTQAGEVSTTPLTATRPA
jgi:hypothetical protein